MMEILTGVWKSNVIREIRNPNGANAIWNYVGSVQAMGCLGNAGVVNAVLQTLLNLGVAVGRTAVRVDPELIGASIDRNPDGLSWCPDTH